MKKSKEGISITELLIVVAVLAMLMIVFLAAFKPWTQQAKARDARRKSDLQKLKNPLEDYYNDHDCYPEALPTLKPYYLGEIPVDPITNEPYEIENEGCDKYRIYVKLENRSDSEIVEMGCGAGCGPGGDAGTCEYNYGVCSSNTELEQCTKKCDGRTDPICQQPETQCGTALPGACCTGIEYQLTCYPDGEIWCCPIE